MRKLDACDNLIAGRTLPSHIVSCVIFEEPRVTLDEAAALRRLERDDSFDEVPPPTNDIEDLLAVNVDVEEYLDLWDSLPFGPIHVWLILPGDFSEMQGKVCLYVLEVPGNAETSCRLCFGV